jgi:hypothetical protein
MLGRWNVAAWERCSLGTLQLGNVAAWERCSVGTLQRGNVEALKRWSVGAGTPKMLARVLFSCFKPVHMRRAGEAEFLGQFLLRHSLSFA